MNGIDRTNYNKFNVLSLDSPNDGKRKKLIAGELNLT